MELTHLHGKEEAISPPNTTECNDRFVEDSWNELRNFQGPPHKLYYMTVKTIECATIAYHENVKTIHVLTKDNVVLQNRLYTLNKQLKELAKVIFQDKSITKNKDMKFY